jgi:hypothetical protein
MSEEVWMVGRSSRNVAAAAGFVAVGVTAAALGVLWFLAFLVVIPIAPLQSNGVPAPWYGRLYAAGVTLAFAGVFAAAFRSLGREETRSYFHDVRAG